MRCRFADGASHLLGDVEAYVSVACSRRASCHKASVAGARVSAGRCDGEAGRVFRDTAKGARARAAQIPGAKQACLALFSVRCVKLSMCVVHRAPDPPTQPYVPYRTASTCGSSPCPCTPRSTPTNPRRTLRTTGFCGTAWTGHAGTDWRTLEGRYGMGGRTRARRPRDSQRDAGRTSFVTCGKQTACAWM